MFLNNYNIRYIRVIKKEAEQIKNYKNYFAGTTSKQTPAAIV
jgi:hypothetical protein